jgi:large subunit GTPase 1
MSPYGSLEEEMDMVLTPYERNLEVWRQLWRVCERSDIVIQIVDARAPLFYRSVDLECYVRELGNDKRNLLLINKADYLSENQRCVCVAYMILILC